MGASLSLCGHGCVVTGLCVDLTHEHRGNKPVLMQSGLSAMYFGKASPKKNENPMMNRLRDELRSTNCRFEIPTAVIMPGKETH